MKSYPKPMGISDDETNEWLEKQYSTICDFEKHFDGDLDEFVALVREGRYGEAHDLLNEKDHAFIQKLLWEEPEYASRSGVTFWDEG